MRDRFNAVRTGIGILLALVVSILIYISNPPWDTPGAATAYYSVLAFLSVTITASVANRIRIDSSPSNNILFAVTGYASVIFAGAAIFYIITNETPVIHAQTSGVFLNLVALATTGVIMVLYSTLDQLPLNEDSIWEKRSTPMIIIAVASVIFVSLMLVARQPIPQIYFLVSGYITGAIATVSFTLAAIMIFKNRRSNTSSDPYRMMLSFLFFAGASINHMLILPDPSAIWIITITLMGLGLIIANIGIGYPFLRDIGVHEKVAYGVTLITSLFAVAPFIIAQGVEVVVGSGMIPSIGATILVHIGGSVLAGLSAYSLCNKLQEKWAPGQLAIVYLLLYWMIAEMAIVLSHFTPIYGLNSETQVPYIAGSIISAMILIIAVRSVLNPTRFRYSQMKRELFIGFIGPPSIIIIGEYLRLLSMSMFPMIPSAIMGSAIMLGMSYVSLYALLTYILLTTGASGGELTYESIGAALASIWIIVIILKTNFGYATAGWWVAESIMYISIVFFSILTLHMYLTASRDLKKTVPAAAAFSHILSETIVDHQETAIDRLTELTRETQTSEKRLDLLASSLHELSRANEFAKYIQAVITETKFDKKDLESVNLTNVITSAMNRLSIPGHVLKLKEENAELKTYCVSANNLLIEVFYYLFMGISKRIGPIELVGVDISELDILPEKQIETIFDIMVQAMNVTERIALIQRYSEGLSMEVIEFSYAKRILGLFEGKMNWKTEPVSNQGILITVKIILPAV